MPKQVYFDERDWEAWNDAQRANALAMLPRDTTVYLQPRSAQAKAQRHLTEWVALDRSTIIAAGLPLGKLLGKAGKAIGKAVLKPRYVKPKASEWITQTIGDPRGPDYWRVTVNKHTGQVRNIQPGNARTKREVQYSHSIEARLGQAQQWAKEHFTQAGRAARSVRQAQREAARNPGPSQYRYVPRIDRKVRIR
jgi:hypothetical protein